MKAALVLSCLAAALCLPAAQGQRNTEPLTLDPELYADALREVQGLPARSAASSRKGADEALPVMAGPLAGVEDWQAAMRDAGTELADVRLLVLLQRLNPQEPPDSRAEDYAEALRLHHLMLAGNARACRSLARACRSGRLESGLAFIRSEALARILEQRAAAFQPPRLPERQQDAAAAAACGEQEEQEPGASS